MVLLSVEQAAKRLKKTDRTIRRWITEGKLAATHPTHGRKEKFLIEESEIERLATELQQEQGPEQEMRDQDTSSLESRVDALEQKLERLENVLLSLVSPEPGPAAKKRATASVGTLETPIDIPQGSLLHTLFAEHHGVHTRTFRDHIDKGNVPAIKRPKVNRPGEVERWLTSEDQQRAVEYWQEIGTPFNIRPDLYPTLDYGIFSELEQEMRDQDSQ